MLLLCVCASLFLSLSFTSTETVDLLGTGAQDVHLDFHTAPELSPSLSLFLMIILMVLVTTCTAHFTLSGLAMVKVCDDKVSVMTYFHHFTLPSMAVHGDRHQEGVGRL